MPRQRIELEEISVLRYDSGIVIQQYADTIYIDADEWPELARQITDFLAQPYDDSADKEDAAKPVYTGVTATLKGGIIRAVDMAVPLGVTATGGGGTSLSAERGELA